MSDAHGARARDSSRASPGCRSSTPGTASRPSGASGDRAPRCGAGGREHQEARELGGDVTQAFEFGTGREDLHDREVVERVGHGDGLYKQKGWRPFGAQPFALCPLPFALPRPYGKTDLGFASHAGYVAPARAQSRAAYKGGRS